ncbi:hypothetical protein T459_35673 [Capsicum annuum]|uniref:Uncharacterized protein n=1 Tax=Capsicum annuum TaxID=4072 RepID=A0A2G2VWP6_CAPAN|nr:hypothetical protein T459_35673 [Capsicum annuum]
MQWTLKIQAKLFKALTSVTTHFHQQTYLVADFDTRKSKFSVELTLKTLRKTSLIELEQGFLVNLERGMKPRTKWRWGREGTIFSNFLLYNI